MSFSVFPIVERWAISLADCSTFSIVACSYHPHPNEPEHPSTIISQSFKVITVGESHCLSYKVSKKVSSCSEDLYSIDGKYSCVSELSDRGGVRGSTL